MIKLLYTINGLRVNGMSAVIMQYISHLDPKEYSISIFTDEIADQFLPELKKHHVEIITSQKRRKNQLAYYKELKNLLLTHNFDIIHAHGNSATLAVEMLAAKKCNVKVRMAHSHNTTCTHKIIDKLLRPLFYKTYTDGIGCGEQAGKWLFGTHPHSVIKNGVDLRKFQFDSDARKSTREKLNINEKIVIGHIGRFTDQKNHEYILDVFQKYHKEVPNSVLLLVGDGPLEKSIKIKSEEIGLKDSVIFYGTVSDTAPLYSVMDFFLFPSKFEGVPLTLVEAQANGLPCLISDRISREVIHTDLITVLPLDDTDRWVQHISMNESERANHSQEAVLSLKDAGFDVEGVIREIDELYKTALFRG